MVPAFIAIDGRSASAHAALLAAYGLAVTAKCPVTLVRVTAPGEGPLPVDGTMPDAVRLVEHALADPAAGSPVDGAVEAARQEGRAVVLDVPLACLTHGDRRPRTRLLPILPVGPTLLDERLAAVALRNLRCRGTGPEQAPTAHDGGIADPSPSAQGSILPWLLGLARSGGKPARAGFAAAMRTALASSGGHDTPVRTLPVTLPALSRAEAASLLAGRPQPWLLRSGLLLAAALRVAAEDPPAAGIDPSDFAAGLGDRTLVTRDDRDATERLRDLADALQAIRDGVGPSPEELAAAPLLDNWAMTPKLVRALVGQSHGHPDFPPGRAVTTSEVYATDGRTYARTYSRLYRLGTPAPSDATTSMH